MKKVFLSLILFSFIAVACSKKNDLEAGTFEYFNTHLKADMKYDAIVRQFGTPEDDIGSGIHIYVYSLTDGTAIWIGYTNAILYARHVDANMQILHTII